MRLDFVIQAHRALFHESPAEWLCLLPPMIGMLLAHCLSPRKEQDMMRSLQIFLGLVIGCVGFLRISENPEQGSTALLVGGFLILAGIDHLFEIHNK